MILQRIRIIVGDAGFDPDHLLHKSCTLPMSHHMTWWAYLDAGRVCRIMEEDEEGDALLGELLRILKGDLPDEGAALLRGPVLQLLVAICAV